MIRYHHVLAALELEDASRAVLQRAHAMAAGCGARLSVLHVLEVIPMRPPGFGELDATMMAPAVDLTGPMMSNARRQVLPWLAELGIPEDALELIVDNVKSGIAAYAERKAADLLVIGRHPHHGLSAIFSHTEQGVLSRAACDVLVVALPGN